MTPSDQKQLAEKAAEFLGFVSWVSENVKYWNSPESEYGYCFRDDQLVFKFFESDDYSAIFMHLAKREMEKRGFSFKHELSRITDRCHSIGFWKSDVGYRPMRNENEYRAFWLALEQAVKGGK